MVPFVQLWGYLSRGGLGLGLISHELSVLYAQGFLVKAQFIAPEIEFPFGYFGPLGNELFGVDDQLALASEVLGQQVHSHSALNGEEFGHAVPDMGKKGCASRTVGLRLPIVQGHDMKIEFIPRVHT